MSLVENMATSFGGRAGLHGAEVRSRREPHGPAKAVARGRDESPCSRFCINRAKREPGANQVASDLYDPAANPAAGPSCSATATGAAASAKACRGASGPRVPAVRARPKC